MVALALRAPLLSLVLMVLGAGGDPRGVLAGVAVAGLSAILLAWATRALRLRPRSDPWSPPSGRAPYAAFVRQRDPDAAGRPRPRAPSASPAPA
jgi:hypothetical protein